MRRVNARMDALTRKLYPVEELLRLSKVDGKLVIKPNGGRGIYIAKNAESLEKLKNEKLVSKRLGASIDKEEIAKLEEAL